MANLGAQKFAQPAVVVQRVPTRPVDALALGDGLACSDDLCELFSFYLQLPFPVEGVLLQSFALYPPGIGARMLVVVAKQVAG